MTVYDEELAAVSRTPQAILLLGLTSCANWYAQRVTQELWSTEVFTASGSIWAATGGVTVTPNTVTAPDGTLTADTVAFAGADYIVNPGAYTVSASNAFTGSIFLRAAAPGTITIRLHDGAAAEIVTSVVNVTTGWQRFWVHILFTAGATVTCNIRLERQGGDLASVYAWGANITHNPSNNNAEVKFAYSGAFIGPSYASTCQAVDAGNGSRCYYSFPTCQDPANFNAGHTYEAAGPLQGIKEIRFCRKDAPLPLGGVDIYPMIKSVQTAAQRIDPERAVTVNERVEAMLEDDTATWNWNQDKASDGALTNTTTPSGTFWRRFMKIYRNYANPRNYGIVKVGFVAAGMSEALYAQRGKYLMTDLAISGDGSVSLSMADKLRLTKRTGSGTSQAKAPAKISDTNLLNGSITNVATTMIVDDATQITTPDPAGQFNVCLEIDHGAGTAEFVNVTAINLTTSTLTIQRGRWGTPANAHADNVIFREVLQFGTEHSTPSSPPRGKNPVDIVVELLRRAGIAMADIDTTTLYDERDTWLYGAIIADADVGITFRRCGATVDSGNGAIAQQSDVEELIKQIREITMLSLWVGEDQRVTGRLFAPARPTVTLVDITDSESIVKNSIEVDDNEESRLTRIVVGYNIRADVAGGSLADYENIHSRIGTDEENAGSYGDQRSRIILSPWIRSTDSATVSKLTAHMLGRFRNPARRINLDLELRDDGIKCGDFVNLTTAHIQKADGSSDGPRIVEALSKSRKPSGTISYEFMDTGLTKKYGFIAPAGQPNWDSATAAQKRYCYIGSAANNQVGALPEDGFYIW